MENQALSWLKTYCTDQALIVRRILTLDKYQFWVKHRPRTQHRNADGLSKRTNEYRWLEKQLAQLPPPNERWNFPSANEFDKLPVAPLFDVQGRVIPNHPVQPEHFQNMELAAPSPVRRVHRRTQRANKRDKQAKALAAPSPPLPSPELQVHEDFYPNYPEDWIDVTEEASEVYLLSTHAANVPSRTIYSVNEASTKAMQGAPSGVRDSVMALRDIDTDLHEHANTVHGIKHLVLAQNCDVHVLAIKKLVLDEPMDNDIFPEDVREFARNYFRQKKGLLTLVYQQERRPLCAISTYPTSSAQTPVHDCHATTLSA